MKHQLGQIWGLLSTSILVGTLSISLIACGGSSSSKDDSQPEPVQSAFLSVSITDAPIDDATEVVVQFTGVEIKPAEGSALEFNFSEPKSINLLELQGQLSSPLLDNVELPAGDYGWIRLKVNAERNVMDSYITFDDGNSYSLFIPSGDQRGLQLNSGFTLAQGMINAFTIDFDLRKSIIAPPGQQDNYFLKPTLRIVDNMVVSHIQGTIDATLLNDESCLEGAAVYLYPANADSANIADDEGSENSPLASSTVALIEENYTYEIGYLIPGNYFLALTCDADIDVADQDDDIEFIQTQTTTAVANEVTVVNFQ